MAGTHEDLELLFHGEKSNFLSRNDVLVVAIHSFLLEEGARCVGKGDQWAADEDLGKGSKKLPRLWNEDQEKITLKYVIDGLKVIMSVFSDKDNTMVNLKELRSDRYEAICVDVEAHISRTYDTFESAYMNLDELHKKVKAELFKPVLDNAKKMTRHDHGARDVKPQQTWIDDDDDDPLRVPGSRHYPRTGAPNLGPTPFGYGRSDLNPFPGLGGPLAGPGGSGMLFTMPRLNREPQIPGILPRGSVPPGARFDPFGPSTGMRMPRPPMHPDPDVGLPPPGSQDMFM